MTTGARTGGEPSGAHWDHRAAARDAAQGPGRYTNTGHGAAFVAIYSHSSNIVDVLSDLLDKAQTELDDTRHTESNAAHSFSLLQQSLEDQLVQLNRALKKAKADVAEFTTSLDAQKADLVEVEKSLSASVASEAASKTVASKWPPSTRLPWGFAEEMKALADVTQVLQSETGGAVQVLRCRHTSQDSKWWQW